MTSADSTLLIVEDDASFARALRKSFERRGFSVYQSESVDGVKQVLDAVSPN